MRRCAGELVNRAIDHNGLRIDAPSRSRCAAVAPLLSPPPRNRHTPPPPPQPKTTTTQPFSVLGSTGSIGTQTLDIIAEFPDKFKLVALSAGSNVELLAEQVRRAALRAHWHCILGCWSSLILFPRGSDQHLVQQGQRVCGWGAIHSSGPSTRSSRLAWWRLNKLKNSRTNPPTHPPHPPSNPHHHPHRNRSASSSPRWWPSRTAPR